MKHFVLCALAVSALMMCSCSQNREPSNEISEPALSLTEEQKASGAGYWAFVVQGPVVNESLNFVCSEGSRGMYMEDMQLTRVLARDVNNPKTVLMIDFNAKRRGEYMLNPKSSDTVMIVVGIAGDDGTMRFSGTVDKESEGSLRISHYVEGGYIEGQFGGTMKIEKQPHLVQGRFRVRMRK